MCTVSAVITTHKRQPQVVERALNSVLSQTYPNMEVIVVDDSPEEFESREQVKQTAERYGARYIPHSTCRGACAARNTGLAAASGEFIAFLDDDDTWFPEKIEKQLRAFTDEAALVYCGNNIYDETTGKTGQRKAAAHRGMVYDKLIAGNFIGSTSFPLIRRACLLEIGGFDVQMQSAQDMDVWLRLAEKYPVEYVDEPLVCYYVHEGDQISKNYKKRISGQERLIEKNLTYLQTHKRSYGIRLLKLAAEYAADGRPGKALKLWLKAVAICPANVKNNAGYLARLVRNTIR